MTSYGLTRIDSSDHELDILLVYSMIEITIFQKIGSCIPILGNASPLLSLLCPSHSKPVQGNAWDHPRAHWLVLGEEKTTAWGRESICTGYASCKFRLVVLLARGSEIMVSIFSMRERFFFPRITCWGVYNPPTCLNCLILLWNHLTTQVHNRSLWFFLIKASCSQNRSPIFWTKIEVNWKKDQRVNV